MKIEMGESLFYSWLRHVKECQVVQTNWKVSSQWELSHNEEVERFFRETDRFFYEKYGYKIFKQNSSLSQILQQGECDVIGVSIQNGENHFYAVDVAFHGAGLNYGSKEETVMKVIAKLIRTALILYGYMGTKSAEIIFAAPKINPTILNDLIPCMTDMKRLFSKFGWDFDTRLICNEDFHAIVLKPILFLSDGVSDTSELFLRSYQMFTMFDDSTGKTKAQNQSKSLTGKEKCMHISADSDAYKELKVGQLARKVFGKMLEAGYATEEEVRFMQQAEYSKQFFHLNYPVLVLANSHYNPARYYTRPIQIRNHSYMLCNDWYESSANNDRVYLMRWILSHSHEK